MILQRKLKHHFLAILMSWSIVLQSMHLEKVARRAISVMCTFVSKYLALAEAGILHNDFLPELSVLPTSLHFLCTTFTLLPFANNQDPFCYWFLVNLGRTIHARQNQPLKNRARGNRKTIKRPKMMLNINFRNLKLKSHDEYMICRTYFVMFKTWFSS